MKQAIDKYKEASENVLKAIAEMMDATKEITEKLDKIEITPQGEWLDVNEHTAEKRCSNCGRVSALSLYCNGCGSHNIHRQKD